MSDLVRRVGPVDGPTVVLVHGAWGHPADWDDVVDQLVARGVAAVVADLPTMRDAGATVLDDGDHVADLARSTAPPVVLCGHSYGGAVITQAAGLAAVSHLVYVAALLPDVGEAPGQAMGGAPSPDDTVDVETDPGATRDGVEVRDDGTTLITGWAAPDWDYPAEALARMARNQRRPFAGGGMRTPLTAAGWRELLSTYVLAERDASLAPVRQREMAQRCARLVELDSGHMVAHEHPEWLGDLLADIAAAQVDPASAS